MAPAQEHMFDEEPLPPAVVFDCDFVINVLHENEDFHDECAGFAGRLFDRGVGIVYSSLVRVDFWQGWRHAVKQKGLPLEIGGEPVRIRDLAKQREEWYQLGDQYPKLFLSLYDRYEVRVGPRLLDRAVKLMGRYNLGSHDACLAAIAFHTDVTDIVSLDADFRRVDGIHLWNSDIPARRLAARRR
jgi:predicted nucleic acid-binding protein